MTDSMIILDNIRDYFDRVAADPWHAPPRADTKAFEVNVAAYVALNEYGQEKGPAYFAWRDKLHVDRADAMQAHIVALCAHIGRCEEADGIGFGGHAVGLMRRVELLEKRNRQLEAQLAERVPS